jgi:hypothetical protein
MKWNIAVGNENKKRSKSPGVRKPAGARKSSVPSTSLLNPGPTQPCIPRTSKRKGFIFPQVKGLGHEADRSPPLSAADE